MTTRGAGDLAEPAPRGCPGSMGEIVISDSGDGRIRRPVLRWFTTAMALLASPAVIAQVDLEVEFTGPDEYVPGESGAYVLTVTNNGPDTDNDVTLTTDFSPVTSIGWSCESNGDATCGASSGSGDLDQDADVLEAGGTLTYEIDVQYPSDLTEDPLEVSASVEPGSGADLNETVSSDLRVETDLSLAWADPGSSYTPGTTGNYTLTLTNNGPSDAADAVFSLVFPEDVAGWSCDPAPACMQDMDGNIATTLDLAAGANQVIDLAVDYDSGALADPLVLSPRLDPAESEDDQNDGNNQADASFDIDRQADIRIVKTASEDSVSPNGEFLYYLEITNNGPSDVGNGDGEAGILLNDVFPEQLEGVAQDCPGNDGSQPCWYYCPDDQGEDGDVTADDCPVENSSGQGDIADLSIKLAAGNTSTVRAHVSANASTSGIFSNTAMVAIADGDGVTEIDAGSGNSSSAEVEIVIQSDFYVEKTDYAVTAVPGEEHSYEIRVVNDGFIGADDVRVSDQFPIYGEAGTGSGECPAAEGAGFETGTVSWQCQATDGACCNHNSSLCGLDAPTAPASGDELDQGVDLAPGSEVVFTVTGTLHPRASGTLCNLATIEIPDGIDDPDEDNNTDIDDDTDLTPEAGLEIEKRLVGAPAAIEDGAYELLYRIEVVNNGPSYIDDATVSDDLADSQLLDATATWTCTVENNPGQTACEDLDAGDRTGLLSETVALDPDGEIHFDLTVQTDTFATGEVVNTAQVDSTAGYDEVTLTTSLTAEADLAISKTDNAGEAAPGTEVEYIITLENTGPDDVFGATVTDTFPSELQDVSWTCEATTPVPGDLNLLDKDATDIPAMDGGRAVTHSDDGRQVYVASYNDNAIYVYDRNNVPGAGFGRVVLQETERNGIDDAQDPGAAVSGMVDLIDMVLAPDQTHLYVLAGGDDSADPVVPPALITFSRVTDPADPDYGNLTYAGTTTAGIPGDSRRLAVSDGNVYVSGSGEINEDGDLGALIAIYGRDLVSGVAVHDVNKTGDLPPAPGALAVDAGGALLFAGSSDGNGLSVYSIDPAQGGDPAGRLSLLHALTDPAVVDIGDLALAPDMQHVYATSGSGDGGLSMIDYSEVVDDGQLVVDFEYDDDDIVSPPSGVTTPLAGMTRIAVAPDGEHLLGVNALENFLFQFRRDPVGGGLTYEDGFIAEDPNPDYNAGDLGPADISIAPNGRHVFVAAMNTHEESPPPLAVYSRRAPDPLFAFVEADARDADGDGDIDLEGLAAPNDVVTSPDGRHVYAVSLPDHALTVFRRHPDRGVTDDTLGGHLEYIATYTDGVDGFTGLDRPRRIAISPDGHNVFVTSEGSNTLAVFHRNTDDETSGFGQLEHGQTFTDGAGGVDGLLGAQGMVMDTGGRQLYVAGSFDAAIAIFDRDPDDDSLTFREAIDNGTGGVSGLSGIRDLALASDAGSPDSQLLGVSAFDNALVVFNRDNELSSPDLGGLEFVQAQQQSIGTRPMALAIPVATGEAGGEHVYVAAQNSHSVAVLRRVTDPASSAFGQVQPLAVTADGDDGIDFLRGARDVAVSPDGKRVYLAAEYDSAVHVFDRNLNAGSETFGQLNPVEVRRDRVNGVDGIENVRALTVSGDSRNVYGAGFGDAAVASFLLGTGSVCTAGGAGNINDTVDIGANGTLVYRATGTLRPGALGILSNTADVAVPENVTDDNSDNDSATDTTLLVPEGDVSVTKTSDQVSVVAGETAHYTVAITNPGPSSLIDETDYELSLTDLFNTGDGDPDNDHFVTDSIAWTCTASGSGALDFVDAYDAGDFGGTDFSGLDGISGLTRVAGGGDGSPVDLLAGASVLDNALVLFPRDPFNGTLAVPTVIADGDMLGGEMVTTLTGARAVVASDDGRFVYVGGRVADAITIFELSGDGSSGLVVDVAGTQSGHPGLDQVTHLALSPDGAHLYAAGPNDDAVAVFARDESTGGLTWLESEQNGVDDSTDPGATVGGLADVEFLAVSPDGDHLYALSAAGGNVVVFDRDPATGRLSWRRSYGEIDFGVGLDGAAAAVLDSDGEYLYVAAGGASRVLVLDRDTSATGSYGELSLASAIQQSDDGVGGLAGVRHLAMSADDVHVYATSTSGDTVAWFVRNQGDGSLDYRGLRGNTNTQIDGLGGASELVIDDELDQLYVAGTGQDAVAQFSRTADSFCPASGAGLLEGVPFNIAAGGEVTFEIEAEIASGVTGEVDNTATVTADRDTNPDNNTGNQSNVVSEVADLIITKDDGLSEYDGLAGASAIAGNEQHLYVAGTDDDAIGVFARDDDSGSPGFGGVEFIDAIRGDDDGIVGLGEVADLALSGDQGHLYAVSSGENALVAFERDPLSGALTFLEVLQNGVDGVSGISGARAMAVSPDDAHVYVLGGFANAVSVFERVTDSGAADFGGLHYIGSVQSGVAGVDGLTDPVALAVSPDGAHVYVLGAESDTLAAFERNPSSGSAGYGQLSYVTHYSNNADGVAGLAGVRDLLIGDGGTHVYVLGGADGTLARFTRDSSSGELDFVEYLEDGVGDTAGLNGAEGLRFGPLGEMIYVAGAGQATIARYTIDGADGSLSYAGRLGNGDPAPLTGGEVFGLDGVADVFISPDGAGAYAVAGDADSLSVFDRGGATAGELAFRDILIDGLGGVAPGEQVTYTISVENAGPSNVPVARVADEFPPQFNAVSWTCTSSGDAECPASGSGNLDTDVVLPVGGRVTFQAMGTVSDTASGALVNTATVTGTGVTDPVPANNSATDDDTVLSPAMDLTLDVDDGADMAVAGEPVTYTVTAANLGPSYAENVRLGDTVPAALYDVDWQCSPSPLAGTLLPPVTAAPSLASYRAVTFSGDGRFAYAPGDSAGVSALGVYRRDPISGALNERQLVKQGSDGVLGLQGAADAVVTPDGRFVYVAAATADSVAVFERDATDGELTFVTHYSDGDPGIEGLGGAAHLRVGPAGARLYVAGREDDALAVFAIAPATGQLTQLGVLAQGVDGVDGLNGVSDMAFTADGDHLVVTAADNGSLAVFARNSASGLLAPAALALDFELPESVLATPAALALDDAGGVYVAAAGGDRVDEFGLSVDDDDVTLSYRRSLNADTLDGTTLAAPFDLIHDPDRARLYVATADRLVLVSLLSGAPEVLAEYSVDAHEPALSGLAGLADGPDGAFVYTPTAAGEVGIWNKVRGSRCPLSGAGGLGQQTVDIAPGGELVYEISGWVQPNATGELDYVVTLDNPLPEQELNPADNSDNDLDDIAIRPDLAVTKTSGVESVVAGEGIEYTIDTVNMGPSDAIAAKLIDNPPLFPEVTGGLVPGTGAWSCTANPPLVAAGEFSVPDGAGDLAVGGAGRAVYTTSAAGTLSMHPRLPGGGLDTPQTLGDGDELPGGTVSGLAGASAVTASADERHVYVTGYDADSLVVFTRPDAAAPLDFAQVFVSGEGGVAGLSGPRAVHLSPDERFVYVAAADADSITVFERDADTGELAFVERVRDGLGTIVPESDVIRDIRDVHVDRSGRHLYAVAAESEAVSRFAIDGDTGELTFEAVQRQGDGSLDGLDQVLSITPAPGDEQLYVLGVGAITQFQRQTDGELVHIETWMSLPGVAAPRDLVIDRAGARAYLLDDSGIHVLARDWDDGELEHRYQFPADDAGAMVQEAGAGLLWMASDTAVTRHEERPLSRCLTPTAVGDSVNLDLDLGADGWSEVIFSALVDPSARGELVNTAEAMPISGADPFMDNNSDTDTIEIDVVSDLSVTKSGPAEAVAGEGITYQISVTNAGPSDALGIVVEDMLPAPLVDAQWTCSASGESGCPATGSGDIGFSTDLFVGDELAIEVTADIDPAYVGVITNTVALTPEPEATDPTPGDHMASVDTDVIAVADIEAAKQLDGDGVVAGTGVSYLIDVTNPGPSDAPVVDIVDAVDDRLAEVAWTCSAQSGATCAAASGNGDIDTVIDMPAGSTARIEITGELDVAASGTLANTATADAAAPVTDPDAGNNTATVSHTIQVVPDLSVSLFDPLDPFDPDGSIDLPYEVEVTNAGPSQATAVTLDLDTLPASVVAAPAGCTAGAGTLSCDFGVMAPGQIRQLDLELEDLPAAPGDLVVEAMVTTPDDDPDLANNSTTETTQMATGGDVMVSVDNGFDWIAPNQALTYILNVTNIGSAAVTDIDFETLVPGELLDATWTCMPDAGVTCTPSGVGDIADSLDLQPAASAVYALEVRVDPAVDLSSPLSVDQVATATVDAGDINPVNNSALDSDPVRLAIFVDSFESAEPARWVETPTRQALAAGCERVDLTGPGIPPLRTLAPATLLAGESASGDGVLRILAMHQFGTGWLRLVQRVDGGYRTSDWLAWTSKDLDVSVIWRDETALEFRVDGKAVQRFEPAGPYRPVIWHTPELPISGGFEGRLEVGACTNDVSGESE